MTLWKNRILFDFNEVVLHSILRNWRGNNYLGKFSTSLVENYFWKQLLSQLLVIRATTSTVTVTTSTVIPKNADEIVTTWVQTRVSLSFVFFLLVAGVPQGFCRGENVPWLNKVEKHWYKWSKYRWWKSTVRSWLLLNADTYHTVNRFLISASMMNTIYIPKDL